MKIDFSQQLTSLDGELMKDADTGGDVTLAMVCCRALLSPLVDQHRQPENQTVDEKLRFAGLAQRIFDAKGPLDIPVEDVAVLKDRVGRAYPALVVMRAYALLDPKEKAA